jgi:two-component system, NtrC family, response regulator AtoC
MDDFHQLFFTHSPRMKKIRSVVEEIAKSDASILVKGESGTGKEVVAHAIHLCSARRVKPLVKVNCAAIPKGLLESELFGFDKGAFTGAHQNKPGKFELAHEGTIVLNDVEEIDISVQAKLLQVLQDGAFPRLGGEREISVDTRVIATTKDLLEKLIKEKKFREDLYYRISVMTVTVPPLRDRREQVVPLSDYFMGLYGKKYKKTSAALSLNALRRFKTYDWPGNIRELENVIKRVILFGEESALQDFSCGGDNGGEAFMEQEEQDIPPEEVQPGSFFLKEVGKKAAESAEREFIERTLVETRWNRKEAALLLRISYKALLYKIQKYGLDESGDVGKRQKTI